MALLTFDDLTTELAARGFQYLPTSRLQDMLNYAYLVDICEADAWPFLESSTTGTAPVTVSDLRTVESVRDTTNSTTLQPIDRRNLIEVTTDLTTVGSPEYYYITGGNVVTTYPLGTGTLTILYWKTPTALSAGADTPLLPARFRSLIVDAAEARAYADDDEANDSGVSQGRFEARLESMRSSLMLQQYDEPDQWVVSRDLYSWEV